MTDYIKRRKKYISEIPPKAKNNLSYKLRKILYPYIDYKITVEGDLGEKYFLFEKEVDDKVLSGLLDLYYDLYFPEMIEKSEVKLLWDLGAHHGFYSIRSLYEYPGSKVISVEPNPDSVRQIDKMIALNNLNDRCEVLNSALSDKKEQIDLYLSGKGSWGDSLYLEPQDSENAIKVETITFKELLAQGKPDIIKCNAEGAEYILIDELEKENIKPLALILMVHPEFGDPAKLLSKSYFLDYNRNDVYSTKKRLRYLFTIKNADRD